MSDCAALVDVPNRRMGLERDRLAPHGALLVAVASCLMLGACAIDSDMPMPRESAYLVRTETGATGDSRSAAAKTELEKATEYWGKQNRENPRDLTSALNYARNLKASGQKGDALQVLQQAATYHGQDRQLASEYGRLALDLGQTNVAQQVLSLADDPSAPDWRVISARGTVLAKQGKYSEAIPFYEKALRISNNEPSVLNNLALAYTMSGEAKKAEDLLRQAANGNSTHTPRIRQNLALVLGVQGRHEEAQQLAASHGSPDTAANAVLLAQMVKAPSQPAPLAMTAAKPSIATDAETGAAVGGWATRVVPAAPAR